MYCRYCGKLIGDNDVFCCYCGRAQNRQEPVVVKVDQTSGLDKLIPPNSAALWAYYLGIFTGICFILGIPALIMGILGIRYANQHPEAKGKVHAWVGIILGGLGILLWGLMIAVIVYNVVTKA